MARATVDGAGDYEAVVEDAAVVPALVSGSVTDIPDGAVLAIAVNGRVEATTRTYPAERGGQFAAMVPPNSLRTGSNTVTVLQVMPDGRLRPAAQVGGPSSPNR